MSHSVVTEYEVEMTSGLILTHSSSWWEGTAAGHEAAAHIAPSVKEQKELNAGIPLVFSFIFSFEPPCPWKAPSIFRVGLICSANPFW